MTLQFHPLANLFPLIEGAEFAALVADVKENGLQDEIVLLDGMILDGRNRYRAAVEAGLIPEDVDPRTRWEFVNFSDEGMDGTFSTETVARGPLAWVLSKNLHRRHLNTNQRAIVAAKVANLSQGQRKSAPSPTDGSGLFQAREAGEAAFASDAVAETKPANLPVSGPVDQATAAAALSVSERTVRSAKKVLENPLLAAAVERGDLAVSAAEKALALSEKQQQEVVRLAGEGKSNAARTVMKKAARDEKEARLGEKQRALPSGQFGVIYADDEWRWEPWSRETGMDRAADNHYPTSSLEEIKARDVAGLAAPDCALFMWATAPMIREAQEVMAHRGFEYKTQWVWKKVRPGAQRGPGYWNTGEHEILLLGTRGNVPCPAPGTQWPSLIESPVGDHSEKPDVFAQMIAEYFPSLPKIELNARRARPGWTIWGNEAPEQVDIEEAPAPKVFPVKSHEEIAAEVAWAARVKAVTNEHGLVEISGSHRVAADFVTAKEVAEAEVFQAERRARELARDRRPAAARVPDWADKPAAKPQPDLAETLPEFLRRK